MEDKITIIEGPTPTFEQVSDGWAVGLNESPLLYEPKLTRLRTYNGPALVERCHRAWQAKSNIYLHYRNEMGLEEKAFIMAARTIESEGGDILLLWIREEPEDIEVEFGFEDDLDYDDEVDDETDSDTDQDDELGENFNGFDPDN